MEPRKQLRRNKYDYSRPGTYFVTILTKKRRSYFGHIKDKTMHLSKVWNICHNCIESLPQYRPYVDIHSFVVMQDHVHILLWVENHDNSSITLSSIVGNLKAMVSRKCNEADLAFKRHRSFHDRIVRNEKQFDNIINYIRTNPERR